MMSESRRGRKDFKFNEMFDFTETERNLKKCVEMIIAVY